MLNRVVAVDMIFSKCGTHIDGCRTLMIQTCMIGRLVRQSHAKTSSSLKYAD